MQFRVPTGIHNKLSRPKDFCLIQDFSRMWLQITRIDTQEFLKYFPAERASLVFNMQSQVIVMDTAVGEPLNQSGPLVLH